MFWHRAFGVSWANEHFSVRPSLLDKVQLTLVSVADLSLSGVCAVFSLACPVRTVDRISEQLLLSFFIEANISDSKRLARGQEPTKKMKELC